jgi:hypothetical protein
MSCRDSTGKAACGIDVSATDAHARVGGGSAYKQITEIGQLGSPVSLARWTWGLLASTRRTKAFLCDGG